MSKGTEWIGGSCFRPIQLFTEREAREYAKEKDYILTNCDTHWCLTEKEKKVIIKVR